MRGAYSLGWRYLNERRARSILTGAGVAIGVALVVGVLVASASTSRAFDNLIASINGRSDAVITPVGAADAFLPASEAERVARLPGVRRVVPSVAFQARAGAADANGRPVRFWLEGVDLRLDAQLRSWRLLDGRLPQVGADEIAVGRDDVVHGRRPRVGDVIAVATPTGISRLTVSAIVTNAGLGGRSSSDSLTVMGRVLTSVETARRLAGSSGYNAISVLLRPGINPDAWVSQHRESFLGLDVKTTTAAQRSFRNLLDAFLAALVWVASISLFISGFLIYLTLNRALLERTSTIGLMRAVGASRRQLRAAVLSEAATLGVVFSAIGVVFGLLVAAGMTRLLTALGFPPVGLMIRPGAVATGAVVGVGTTVLSAVIPARRVGRIQPGTAMRGPAMDTRLSRMWIIGAACVGGGVAMTFVPIDSRALFTVLTYLVTAAVLLGCVLLVPPVLRPLASALGQLTRRLARGTGDVSVRHLVRERSRSAYTLGLLMVVLAGLFTFGSIDASIARAIDDVFQGQFGRPDALVRSEESLLPTAVESRVRSQPGVAKTSAVRDASTQLLGTRWSLSAMVIDPDTYFDVGSYPFVAGDEFSAKRDLRLGGILLSEAIAQSEGIRRGDRVLIATSGGPKEFVVAGVIKTLPGLDAVFGIHRGREYLNSRDARWLLVRFKPGLDVASEIGGLRSVVEPFGASVVSIGTLQQEFERYGVRQLLRVFLVILLVAALIGLLGLANTLAMSLAERVREIAVMRATGASAGAIRRMVIVESATLGLAAFVLAVPLGWLMSTLVTRGSSVSGLPLRVAFPAGWIPIVCVIGLIVAAIAALVPARHAARLRPADALRFE